MANEEKNDVARIAEEKERGTSTREERQEINDARGDSANPKWSDERAEGDKSSTR